MVANAYGQNSSIAANRYMVANLCGLPEIFIAMCRAVVFKYIINKHNAMTYKTIMADSNQLTNERVWLYAAIIANGYVFLYLGKGADKAIVANDATIYIAGGNNGNIVAGLYIGCNMWFYNFITGHIIGYST